MPITVHVVGRSGSGKTTTVEYLTKHLAGLGFRVGVVKHVHKEGFTFDAQGKDTWRHAKAGASIVVGVAPNELALFKKTEHETRVGDLGQILRRDQLDIVIIEGFSQAPSTKHAYKIVTARSANELKQTLARNRPPIVAVTGPVAEMEINQPLRNRLPPIINTRKNGHVLTAIVRKLLRPRELQQLYREASLKHGGACIGLAIGIRSAYLASNILGISNSKHKVTYGTKKCVAEAFGTLFPDVQKLFHNEVVDRITVENSSSRLLIDLMPKKPFQNFAKVLKAPDEVLFKSISLVPKPS